MIRDGRMYIGIVVGLLMLSVVVNVGAVFIATGDPSVAVEEDYYAKAMAWEERQAQAARNSALGWRIEVETMRSVRPGTAGAPARLTLLDADGVPVEDARILCEAFHNARARERQRLGFSPLEEEPGVYEAPLAVHRPGWWELRLHVTRGSETFTSIERVWASPDGSGPVASRSAE